MGIRRKNHVGIPSKRRESSKPTRVHQHSPPHCDCGALNTLQQRVLFTQKKLLMRFESKPCRVQKDKLENGRSRKISFRVCNKISFRVFNMISPHGCIFWACVMRERSRERHKQMATTAATATKATVCHKPPNSGVQSKNHAGCKKTEPQNALDRAHSVQVFPHECIFWACVRVYWPCLPRQGYCV